MAKNEQGGTNLKEIKSWIVGITSVIVVIPALFNAGLDLYNTVMNVPRTNAEKNNTELFSKHFNQEPVVSLPVPVRQGAATYDVRFSIYEEGDVYVEYGDMTQWFPFPKAHEAEASPFSLISTAYADEGRIQAAAAYKQMENIDGDYLIRKKTYADGKTEQQVIDMRSGRIVETKKETASTTESTAEEPETAAPTAEALPPPEPEREVISPFAVIDLNAVKASRTQDAAATICKTAQGNCRLLHAVPSGSECTCPSSKGELKGTAR